jgi:hypothetical protein
MAEPTFRPERRPIDPQEAQESLSKGEQLRQQASLNEMTGEPPVKISGNIPPALLAARQAMRNEQQEAAGNQRGPKVRETPEMQAPPSADTMVTPRTSSTKVDQLIQGMADKKQYDRILLPSKGKFYNGQDGPTDGMIHIRAMTGEEEQILATPRWVKRGQAINMIFNKCIQEKFNSAKFLTPDRTYLLIYLRGISYSPRYDVEVKCPNCDKKFGTEINLDAMMVDNCPDDFSSMNLEDTLPSSGYKFKYRLSTGEDEENVQAYRDRKMRGFDNTGQPDDTLLYRTSLLVEDIEGVNDRTDIQKLLRSLPINDVAYLRTVVNEPPFGVDTKVEIPCESCNQDFEIDLPLEANFFFPRAKRKAQTQA